MDLFVKDLTVIDFSYLCQQRGVVGESWIVDVVLAGDLNDQSMVLDFGIVKKQIKFIIDEAVDHKLLLPKHNQALSIQQGNNDDHWFVDFESERGGIYLQSPICAFATIDCDEINIDVVTRHLIEVILAQLPANVKGLELKLRPEKIDGPFYHYTHGLKKHDGNCQRIAHGHRSPIEILIDGHISEELSAYWAKRWSDIYIATDEDEVDKASCQLSASAKNDCTENHRYFSYLAPQGRFDIAVPASILEVIDCDSTVELLADYIARQIKQDKVTQGKLTVIAYEGVGKGAITHA